MVEKTLIDVQVDHHPSGNLTLKERKHGEFMWSQISEHALLANSDSASFYQAVAKRLAKHSHSGTIVSSYLDTAPTLYME